MLTVLMYWNEVEEGGDTHFPHLNITIATKAERAVIWPSVLNENRNDVDERTLHASLPVVKGAKYGTVLFQAALCAVKMSYVFFIAVLLFLY